MKKILILPLLISICFCLIGEPSRYGKTYDQSQLKYYYWDRSYTSYYFYAEHRADSLYKAGFPENAFYYYRSLAYFYPLSYKGWWGIIRCFSGNFENLDFQDSEILIEKLRNSNYKEVGLNEGINVLELWEKQLPSITKAREERAAAEKRKRSDSLYNMKFVRHDGILEQYNGSDSEVIIPLDVTVIGPAAFRNTSVSRIVFHENVMEIGKDAFANCGSLKSIVIPDTVKIIGEGAFRQCMNLESAVIPGSIEVLPNNLFQGCSRLSSVQIEDGVGEIQKSFVGCKKLSAITIPASVLKIGDFAFSACTELKTISIMSDSVIIGRRALYGTHLENKDELVERFGAECFY